MLDILADRDTRIHRPLGLTMIGLRNERAASYM